MIALNRILFPTDFSECADAALAWAIMLATKFEAELTLFHAVVLHSDDVGDEVYSRFPDLDRCIESLVDEADGRLGRAVPAGGKLVVRRQVRRGIRASDEIVGYCAEGAFELVVMGTYGRRGLGHLLLGSVAERVVRLAPCPVLTVHHDAEHPGDIAELRRVVLPIDFSDPSRLAVRYAVTFARALGAELEVAHVFERGVHPSFYSIGRESVFEVDPGLRERAEEAIGEFMREAGADLPYRSVLLEGKPAAEIAKLAGSDRNTMVVLATHGAGGLERAMLGSTAERVVRLAGCPVLTVKPGEHDFVT